MLLKFVMMEMHVLKIDVMQELTNVFTKVLNVLITMFVLSTNVSTENATFLKRKTVMTMIHVPKILAIQHLDANTKQFHALITMHVPLIPVSKEKDV